MRRRTYSHIILLTQAIIYFIAVDFVMCVFVCVCFAIELFGSIYMFMVYSELRMKAQSHQTELNCFFGTKLTKGLLALRSPMHWSLLNDQK